MAIFMHILKLYKTDWHLIFSHLDGTFNFIASCSFLFVLNVQKFGKDNLLNLDIRSILYYIKKESHWLYILISITLWLFNWYQTLSIFWLRTSYRSDYIYMGTKNWYTHIIFELQSYKLSKNNFYSKYLPSIASYHSQKYFTFTKFSKKKKVL